LEFFDRVVLLVWKFLQQNFKRGDDFSFDKSHLASLQISALIVGHNVFTWKKFRATVAGFGGFDWLGAALVPACAALV
jgi:hypothetical protein